MVNRARIHLILCACMVVSVAALSCGPPGSVSKNSVSVEAPFYHKSVPSRILSVSVLMQFTQAHRWLSGLFKPMEWLTTWQHDVLETASDSPRTVRIAVLADMNGSYGSEDYKPPVHAAVTALIDTFEPSLVISTGDMVAGMKHGLDYEAMWEAFHEAVTHPLDRAGMAFAPTPGNHDGTNRPGFEVEREVYRTTWRANMPDVEFVNSDYYPRRYAFLHEGILFVSIDASTVGRLSRVQRTWLEDVLKAHSDVPAKVVYGHVPLYPFAIGRETEILDDSGLEAMFVKHGVSVYVSGHHHAYYPGRRDNGLRLVSMACLGGGPRRLMQSESPDPSPRALSILEIDPLTGAFDVQAYEASDFKRTIKRTQLPESIGEGDKRIVRDDL